VLAIVCILLLQGCVARSITIKSEPRGARAYLDDSHIGTTPVTVPFRHYGTRRIRVEKEGFETASRVVEMNPPWYQVIILDLICEVLIPYKFHDKRVYSFQLEKAVPDKKGFLERARNERKQLR
jgi:hypothetical protein